MRQPEFHYYRLWHDDQRRLWADRYSNTDLRLARQYHADDLKFGWRLTGQHDRMVTALYGDDGRVRTEVAPGAREDQVDVQPRTFHERVAD